ncbi:hypothetical protein HS088_TW04G00012 [Tripterygium wilfordii]|uniref:Uncharacterized protein n=1 Tax=Tripterygium wilfordii TaxID=458696 RepID=A0A7J7DPD7_TRIWF|nr:uncharacterized protein LOC119997237 [Tripterygium wilfordii]KAF5748064.1 hypothetical protein HS088_TW04G00012 [Tripterygium wilfordii]
MSISPVKLEFLRIFSSLPFTRKTSPKPVHCTPLQQLVDAGIMCEPCNGKGWVLCNFCKGQKTNVRTEKNRIYRRCPSCKAVGCVLCSKCKVFKCVTFPNQSDCEDVSF